MKVNSISRKNQLNNQNNSNQLILIDSTIINDHDLSFFLIFYICANIEFWKRYFKRYEINNHAKNGRSLSGSISDDAGERKKTIKYYYAFLIKTTDYWI